MRAQYQDALAGFALGSVPAKKLLDDLAVFAVSEKARLEAVYGYNVAVAKFEQVLGARLGE
jgi:hypothetical protein